MPLVDMVGLKCWAVTPVVSCSGLKCIRQKSRYLCENDILMRGGGLVEVTIFDPVA